MDVREVLVVRVSYTRSALDAELLLKQLQFFKEKPIIPVDALKRLG